MGPLPTPRGVFVSAKWATSPPFLAKARLRRLQSIHGAAYLPFTKSIEEVDIDCETTPRVDGGRQRRCVRPGSLRQRCGRVVVGRGEGDPGPGGLLDAAGGVRADHQGVP